MTGNTLQAVAFGLRLQVVDRDVPAVDAEHEEAARAGLDERPNIRAGIGIHVRHLGDRFPARNIEHADRMSVRRHDDRTAVIDKARVADDAGIICLPGRGKSADVDAPDRPPGCDVPIRTVLSRPAVTIILPSGLQRAP